MQTFALCVDSDGRQDADQKRTTRCIRQLSCRGSRASVAAAAAPPVREALHEGASTDGATTVSTVARAQQQGHPRMTMHAGL